MLTNTITNYPLPMKKYFSYFCVLSVITVLLTACVRETEPFRSVYHHTPEANWMNDPNGMFFDDATGLWHLYYQHNPEAPVWGPMHWGHSVSKDLIHWEHLPIVLYPDSLGTIFSGSIVIDRNNTAGFGQNAIVAIYTQSEYIGQHQSIAYSLDGGMTFTKYDANPVLMGDIADFRDPKVTWDGDHWLMTLACQQEIRFYSSPDLKHWTYLSSFGEGVGEHGGVWECPELIPMDDKWVLLVSINPGGPFGGSATQYFIGNWDGKEFKPIANGQEQTATKWLDYGRDNYSTFTFHNCPDNRLVSLGWMSNWQYAQQVPTGIFRSQNTIARDLSLYSDDAGEYRVRVIPSPESWAIKGKTTKQLKDACIVELTLSGEETSVITLSNDRGEKVTMTLDVHRQTFSMDRTASGDCSFSSDFAGITTTPLFVHRSSYIVHLFIDRCSIEAFDGEGAWAMTNLVFPSQPYNHIQVVGGEATIYEIKK